MLNLQREEPTPASIWHALAGIPITDELLEWPPDLFALTEVILERSESYRFMLSPPSGVGRQVTAVINDGTTTATSSYVYDGLGQRVSKTTSVGQTIFVYDAFGNLAAEYGANDPSPCGTPTCYVTVDHLGSTRMLTDSTGSSNVRRYDYQPFGAEILAGYGGRTTAMGYLAIPDGLGPKFTGQNRDAETGMDWFQVRHMSGAQGRFQSADPANAGAALENPQTWNAYAYVGNNPLSYTDPSGMGPETGALCAGGPIACGVGVAIGVGLALWDIFGGDHHTPSLTNFPFPNQFPSVSPSGGPGEPWSERLPAGVQFGGGLNIGGVFGGGNMGPFIFSETSSQSPTGFSFGWLWLRGRLPQFIYYPASHPGTQDMRRSTVVQNLRSNYIKAGCPAGITDIDSGHFPPWKESANNPFKNTTQFQVGGFNGAITTSPDGSTTAYTIRNTAGWSSFTGESTWGPHVGLRPDAWDTRRGWGHNVIQAFSWTEPNPCHQ